MGKFLGFKHLDTSVEDLDRREIRAGNDFDSAHAMGWSGPKDQQSKTDIFQSKRGLLHVINQCRKPTHNLKILAGLAGDELPKTKWLYKDQDTMRQIMQAFNIEKMIHQFGAGKYRTDLYFLKYKMAIERMGLTIVIETLDMQ